MFPEQDTLTENMMGFLLCIAKIKKLRMKLLQNHLTSGFIDELFLNQTEIEVPTITIFTSILPMNVLILFVFTFHSYIVVMPPSNRYYPMWNCIRITQN